MAGLSNDELAAVFAEWNSSELESYLIEVGAALLVALSLSLCAL